MRMTIVAVLVSSSAALLVSNITACGGDDGNTQKDAAGSGSGSGSGSAATVTTVSCTGITPTAMVTTDDAAMKYTYSTTTPPSISVGQIIEFKTSVTHDVNPALNGSDPGLKAGFSADVCLKFAKAGTFGFYCSRHGFSGTLTVN